MMKMKMTSYLPIDLQSLLPRASPETARLPVVGEQAPPLPPSTGTTYDASSKGTLVAFVRHCGCPFAEKEVRSLGSVFKAEPEIQIVIVQHSDEEETRGWWDRIDGPRLVPNAKVVADPQRQIYASFGIGVLPWSGLLSLSMIQSLLERKKEGIVNTATGGGSWRWQNSGGLAVDPMGKVRWVKVAQDAGDICDYQQAAGTLVS